MRFSGRSFSGAAVVLPPILAATAGGVVALAGSRSLCPSGAGVVAHVARSLAAAGMPLVVGCATGADAAALAAVSPGSVRCFAAFGPGGVGSWAGSAVLAVSRFAAAGGSVWWWAGGGPAVPLRARLAARTRAVVAQASALVVLVNSVGSRGSMLAARFAAARGVPVLAFPLGFPAANLPPLGRGSWVLISGPGMWACAWVWEPASVQC